MEVPSKVTINSSELDKALEGLKNKDNLKTVTFSLSDAEDGDREYLDLKFMGISIDELERKTVNLHFGELTIEEINAKKIAEMEQAISDLAEIAGGAM